MSRVLIIANLVVSAGVVLLASGCGQNGSSTAPPRQEGAAWGSVTKTTNQEAASTTQKPTVTPPTFGAAGPGDESRPVDCGPVKFDEGTTHTLIATPTKGGLVGCSEAMSVIDAFLQLPPDQRRQAAVGDVAVPNKLFDGWTCTIDDGKNAAVDCAKGRIGNEPEFGFYIEF